MTPFAALAAGSIIGLGIFVCVAAWRGRFRLAGLSQQRTQLPLRHVVVAVVVLIGTWVITGWTLAAATIAGVATMGSIALSRHGQRRDDRALVDALAVWTEQLRDMLAGSNGLEQTIIATSTHAPLALREPLERLVASMSYSSMAQGLPAM
jgi:hypothetical protein